MILSNPFAPSIQTPIENPLLPRFSSGSVALLGQRVAEGSGVITGSVSVWLAVSSPVTIYHGDGSSTVASSASLTEYVITYSSASSPTIRVSDPENITYLKTELGSDFTINFESQITNEIYTNLGTFEMRDDSAIVGFPFSLEDVSILIGPVLP